MKFSAIFATLALSALPSATYATTVAYDTVYDNAGGSLASVACSDGANGLLSRFPTFGSLPHFPHIGAAQAVTGWNSTGCGTCWQLTYTNPQGVSKTINVIAIDVALSGFNIALKAMNELTDNRAEEFGRVDVASKQVAASVCGL